MQKICLQSIIVVFLTMTVWITGLAQSVLLDSTFSGDGKVSTDFGSYDDAATSVAIQKDDKLVAVGWKYNGSGYDIALARYEPDGDLDLTFGHEGTVITKIGNDDSRANSLIIQPDGKIVIAAQGRHDSLGNTVVLVRYNQDGSLDTTFDFDGIVFTAIGKGLAYAKSLEIQNDHKLLVAGYSKIENSLDFILVRYNTNGSIDNSFGTEGKVVTSFGDYNDFGQDLALMKDGKIIVVGYSIPDIELARYTGNGMLDSTFSSDGKVLTENSCSCEYSVAIQKDNKIIVVGEINHDIGVLRYNADGSLDSTFGDNGKVTTDMNGSFDRGSAVVLQDDGKIIVTGQTYGGPYADFALVRYNQDGSLDNTFDFDGKLTTDFANYNDEGLSIVIQRDGKIVIAGVATGVSGYDFGLARYNTSELILVNTEVKVYPNPTFGKIFFEGIDLQEMFDEKKLNLFDVLGREINNFVIEGNSIDLTFLPSAAYFLNFGGRVEKIIKISF